MNVDHDILTSKLYRTICQGVQLAARRSCMWCTTKGGIHVAPPVHFAGGAWRLDHAGHPLQYSCMGVQWFDRQKPGQPSWQHVPTSCGPGKRYSEQSRPLHLGCGLPQCLVGNGATRFLDPVFSGVFQEGPGVATPFGAPRKPPGQVASSLQLMRFT